MKPAVRLLLLALVPACTLSQGGTAPDATGAGGSPGTGAAGGASSGCPAPDPATDPWWDPTFHRRVPISFNNAQRSELVDFPVLIKLDPDHFDYGHASKDGSDLRFVDGDGSTALSHELEGWSSGGESSFWVRVPRIDAASGEDRIWLYYDTDAVESIARPADVWRANYVSVYHFSQNESGAIADSTTLYPGALAGQGTSSFEPGTAASALTLDAGKYVEIGEQAPEWSADVGEARTVQIWFKTRTNDGRLRFLTSQESNCRGWGLAIDTIGEVEGRFFTSPGRCGGHRFFSSRAVGAPVNDGGWHQAALVVDRPALVMTIYIDGKPEAHTEIDNTSSSAGEIHRIGAEWNGNTSGCFFGSIDEFRVARGALTADWISADHDAATGKLVTFGPRSCR